MNFSKHRVSERKMLSEMMDYCYNIISHRRKEDEMYRNISVCISTRTGGVEISYNEGLRNEELLLAIRYDHRNDFYYFIEKVNVNGRVLNSRVLIENKDDFYAYFNSTINQKFSEQ